MHFFASQLFASVAIVFGILGFQFKKREHIIICSTIAASCMFIHFFLLDRTTAALLLLIGIVRFLISLYSRSAYWKYLFISIYMITTYYTYNDMYDLLMFFALSFVTVGIFQNSERVLRICMMLATICAIIFNSIILSPAGILLESMFLVSNSLGYWRFCRKK